jgi:TPR repeat protein
MDYSRLNKRANPFSVFFALFLCLGVSAFAGASGEKTSPAAPEPVPPVRNLSGENAVQGNAASLTPAAENAAPGQNQAAPQTITADMAFAVAAGNAERGDRTAMLTLGNYYEQGIGVNRSYVKALEWYQKAADAGMPEAWYLVGVCYEVGIGNAGDMIRAVRSYERSATLGLPEAMEKLSSLYFSGLGVERNESQGLAYLVQAADAGLASAANSLGGVYLEGLFGQPRDDQRAYGYFSKAADLGDINAIINLGIMYRDGLAITKDSVQALKWFTIASRDQYQGGAMTGLVTELKNTLTEAQIREAEQGAEQWLQAYQERLQTP